MAHFSCSAATLWWVSCPLPYSFPCPHLLNPLLPCHTQPPPNLPNPSSPASADNKNVSTGTHFCCQQAFLSSKIRNMPISAGSPSFPLLRTPKTRPYVHMLSSTQKAETRPHFCQLPSPPQPCQHLKCVPVHVFQVLAGSLLETRSMAHGGHVSGVCCFLCLCRTLVCSWCSVPFYSGSKNCPNVCIF